MKLQFRGRIQNASSLLVRAVLGTLLFCAAAQAASFQVNLNTSSLIGSSSAPFALDFQFNNGGVLGNNAAVISNFNYSGGGPVGSASLFGGAVGNIGSLIFFDNSAAFQEVFQTFTPGTSLKFDVSLSTNSDGATPDAFVFGILDKNLFNIPTSGLGDALLVVNLDGPSPALQTFSGTGEFSSARPTTTVPEPASCVLVLAALPLFALVAARKKHEER